MTTTSNQRNSNPLTSPRASSRMVTTMTNFSSFVIFGGGSWKSTGVMKKQGA